MKILLLESAIKAAAVFITRGQEISTRGPSKFQLVDFIYLNTRKLKKAYTHILPKEIVSKVAVNSKESI